MEQKILNFYFKIPFLCILLESKNEFYGKILLLFDITCNARLKNFKGNAKVYGDRFIKKFSKDENCLIDLIIKQKYYHDLTIMMLFVENIKVF